MADQAMEEATPLMGGSPSLKRRSRWQAAAAAAAATLGAVALALCVGLVADVGRTHAERARLQIWLDGVALAAAAQLDGRAAMIQFLLLQNRQGKTRLSKYYRSYGDEEKVKLEAEIHRTVTTRDPKFTNFVEWRQYKLIYRRYAGLFFTLCVDQEDNELVYFESIHLFVELLDQFFGNVCELDLVFNFNKVYMILDEFFLAGEVQETSKQAILHRVQELDKAE